ncbi:MAG: hypothetical protein II305_03420 [Clostridia bacterium]|nr:hypothetical protein [Clostridia bacterium]
MSERIYLKDWNYEGSDKIRLVYSDNDVVFVSRTDFDRAFGAIINADKNAIVRDFAIK